MISGWHWRTRLRVGPRTRLLGQRLGVWVAAGTVSIVTRLPQSQGRQAVSPGAEGPSQKRGEGPAGLRPPPRGTRTAGQIQKAWGRGRACAFRFPDALGFRALRPDPSSPLSLNHVCAGSLDPGLPQASLPLCKGSEALGARRSGWHPQGTVCRERCHCFLTL